jgi:hypothetical protein
MPILRRTPVSSLNIFLIGRGVYAEEFVIIVIAHDR